MKYNSLPSGQKRISRRNREDSIPQTISFDELEKMDESTAKNLKRKHHLNLPKLANKRMATIQ